MAKLWGRQCWVLGAERKKGCWRETKGKGKEIRGMQLARLQLGLRRILQRTDNEGL